MAKQVRIWRQKVELARGVEVKGFEEEVNKELLELGDEVEKVYVIGVGHGMVVTAVLNVNSKEEKGKSDV